jgi:hypothetical protein
MSISTGNSSHRRFAWPETLGCPIGTRQDILPDFMYELDKKIASASMFVRLLFLPLTGHARWQYCHHVDRGLSLIKFLPSTSDGCITQLHHASQIRIDLQPYLVDADWADNVFLRQVRIECQHQYANFDTQDTR